MSMEMTLTFLGTRGETGIRSRLHRRHASTIVAFRGRRVLIDFGHDWRAMASDIPAEALLITHAHPDHAGGLRKGASCPVYATSEVWHSLDRWPIRERHCLHPWTPHAIAGMLVEAVPVEHSIGAPAVGYRIVAGETTIFYVPDVANIVGTPAALAGVALYVGDGARIAQPLLERRGSTVIGHASIAKQLEWCQLIGVPQGVFTHCGSEIIRAEAGLAEERIATLGREYGVSASVAFDGLTMTVGTRRDQRVEAA